MIATISQNVPILSGKSASAIRDVQRVYRNLRGRASEISELVKRKFQEHLPTFIQVGCVVAIVSIGFFPAYFAQVALGKDMAYAVARGAGAALKIVMPTIFIPTLRMFHAKIQQYLPPIDNSTLLGKLFHQRMALHKYLGISFAVLAVVHTAAHVARFALPFFALEPITGLAMLGLAILPIITVYAMRSTLSKWNFSKSYYKKFLIPHQFGWLGLAAAFAVHTHDFRLLPISAAIYGLFFLDRVWEWKQSKNVPVQKIEKIHQNMIVLEVDKPEGFNYKTGQKIYIAYPPATAFANKVHPFTIASSPDEKVLRFVISAAGEWTRHLVDNLKEGDTVRVSPAFPSPLESGKMDSSRLFISSGSGVAMTIAHLHDIDNKTPISIIHTSRHKEEFEMLDKHIKDLKLNVSTEYFNTANTARFSPQNHESLKNHDGTVYFCGNQYLGDEIEKAVRGKNQIFIREKFND